MPKLNFYSIKHIRLLSSLKLGKVFFRRLGKPNPVGHRPQFITLRLVRHVRWSTNRPPTFGIPACSAASLSDSATAAPPRPPRQSRRPPHLTLLPSSPLSS